MTAEEFEAAYDVLPNGDDPLMDFQVATYLNGEKRNVDGVELALQHFFGETGFGFQANYTVANSDLVFNIYGDPLETQFPLVGLGDTANLVLMYEKEGLQMRLAYNWRDNFLDNQARYANEPSFTDTYSQIDISASYEVSESLTFFFEGINITGEDSRQHGKTKTMLWNLEEQDARYAIGASYRF